MTITQSQIRELREELEDIYARLNQLADLAPSIRVGVPLL
jgi:hypothetical protein